jgi:hypothetical protein
MLSSFVEDLLHVSTPLGHLQGEQFRYTRVALIQCEINSTFSTPLYKCNPNVKKLCSLKMTQRVETCRRFSTNEDNIFLCISW